MSFQFSTFKPDAFETKSYDLLPAGWYDGYITKADWTPNKAGTGHYLNLQFRVDGPHHAGRVLFEVLNLDHPKEKVVEIAQQSLAAICKALGLTELKAPEDLLNKRLQFRVLVKEDKFESERTGVETSKNSLGGYKQAGPTVATSPQPNVPRAAAAPATAPDAPFSPMAPPKKPRAAAGTPVPW